MSFPQFSTYLPVQVDRFFHTEGGWHFKDNAKIVIFHSTKVQHFFSKVQPHVRQIQNVSLQTGWLSMYLIIYWLEVITSSGWARYMHYNREPNIFPLGPPQLSQLAFYHNDRHFSVVFFSSLSSAFCKTVPLYSAALTPSRTALM